jgi:hypothetical protein
MASLNHQDGADNHTLVPPPPPEDTATEDVMDGTALIIIADPTTGYPEIEGRIKCITERIMMDDVRFIQTVISNELVAWPEGLTEVSTCPGFEALQNFVLTKLDVVTTTQRRL